MVLCAGASSLPLTGTPARSGTRPVMMLERAGAQTGALEYQLTKRAPDAARASMCGVFRSVAPRQPRSWQPRSSATMRMKLGRRDTAAGRKAGAAPAAINSLRVMDIVLVYGAGPADAHHGGAPDRIVLEGVQRLVRLL